MSKHLKELFVSPIKVISAEALNLFLNNNKDEQGYLELVAIDLSLGACEPHTVAKECCRQLGLEFKTIAIDCGKGLSAQDIDRQAYGHMGRLIACENAKHIADQLVRNPALKVLIKQPVSACNWEEEDIWLINEIIYLLNDNVDWLLIAASLERPSSLEEETRGGQDRILKYFPGIVSPGIPEISKEIKQLKQTNTCWKLRDGRYFLSAEKYYSPEKLTHNLSDKTLVELNRLNPWFRFYLAAYIKDVPCNPKICRYLATAAFDEGVDHYAIRIAHWITQNDRWPASIRAKYTLILAFIYFYTNQYQPLSELNVDEKFLEPEGQKLLWNRKGYAHVFLEKPVEALYCFDRADNIQVSDDVFSQAQALFRKNIKSLALLKNKDCQGALALQTELANQVKTMAQDAFHIASINMLNIGRLYIKMNRPKDALPYILRFKEMNQGASSDSYTNLQHYYLSVIYESIGHPQKAYQHLLRLALMWLSADSLASISKRWCKTMTNSSQGSDSNIIEKISKKITENLKRVLKSCGYNISFSEASTPAFVRTRNLLTNKLRNSIHRVIHTDDLSVLGASYKVRKRMQGGYYFRQLHQLVWQMICQKCNVLDADRIRTVLIRIDAEYDISSHLRFVLGELPFFTIKTIYHKNGTIKIDDVLRQKCMHRLWVKLHDGIDQIVECPNGIELSYKRFTSKELIQGNDAQLLRKLASQRDGVKLVDLGLSRTHLMDLALKKRIRILGDRLLDDVDGVMKLDEGKSE